MVNTPNLCYQQLTQHALGTQPSHNHGSSHHTGWEELNEPQ